MNDRAGKPERNDRDGNDDTGRADRLLTKEDSERLASQRVEEICQHLKDQSAGAASARSGRPER